MEMGDKKTPYQPKYEPIRCDVSGKLFRALSVRECHDEAVIRRYGVGGKCNVSLWVCRKCKHAIHYQFHGGLGCELDKRVPS